MFFPSPLNYCFEAIIRGASTFVKIQHFKHRAKCHYSVHLPLSSICSVLEGRAGQKNMNIWLTADKQMSAGDGVNSTNPPTPREPFMVVTPGMLRRLDWSVRAAEACFSPSLNDAINMRFCFWNTHSFSRRTLYCSSPLPPSTSWSSFVINSFSNWKQRQNFQENATFSEEDTKDIQPTFLDLTQPLYWIVN